MPTKSLLRAFGAISAGLLLWLAFPDHGLWWTPPIAVALITLCLWRVRARTGALLGFVFGMAFFLPTLSWSGVYVGAFPWTALAVLESLYMAALGAAVALVQRRRIAPFVVACLWVMQEWLRSTTPFGGFPWARLSFSQADAPWAPLIAWVSAPGLTFVLALAGAALASCVALAAPRLFTAERRGSAGRTSASDSASVSDDAHTSANATGSGATPVGDARPDGARGITARLPIAVPAAAASTAVLALIVGSLITPGTSGRMLRVVGVQGNVPTEGLEFNAQRRAVLDNHVHATLDLAKQIDAGATPRPDVVVWPENASDIDPKRNPDAGAEIASALAAVNTPLIVGAVLNEPRPEVSNASMLYLPGKGLSDTYVKQHPVPFGEYIPYRSFFRTFSSQVDLVKADFASGRKVGLFTLPNAKGDVKLAPIICFEVAYDDLLRKPANQGAQIFAVQTNNATFGHTAESTQQLAISRLRALEYGRSIIHVSTVGVSALITPDGQLHERSELFTQKVLTGQLPLRSDATPAQRLGRWPEIAASVVSVVALAFALRHARLPRRRRKNGRGDA